MEKSKKFWLDTKQVTLFEYKMLLDYFQGIEGLEDWKLIPSEFAYHSYTDGDWRMSDREFQRWEVWECKNYKGIFEAAIKAGFNDIDQGDSQSPVK